MIIPIETKVLDFISRTAKNDKVYHNLYCYQAGSDYPKLQEISIKDELVSVAKDLVGQDVTIKVDFYEYNGKARFALVGVA